MCGALPGNVEDSQHHTSVIMPAFAQVDRAGCEIESTDISFAIPMGDDLVGARVLKTRLPATGPMDGGSPVWLIDQPKYFHREGLYGPPGDAYPDNAERFIFFCRAAIMTLMRLGKRVDILHCNDWQTAIIPALIQADPVASDFFRDTRTILTVHNLAYQGHFGSESFPLTGLSWDEFRSDTFEYYNGMNFLKTGLVTADAITTVSPTYAEEICTPEFGCSMEGILSTRKEGSDGNHQWH